MYTHTHACTHTHIHTLACTHAHTDACACTLFSCCGVRSCCLLRYKSALKQYFQAKGQGCVLFERNFRSQHLQLQVSWACLHVGVRVHICVCVYVCTCVLVLFAACCGLLLLSLFAPLEVVPVPGDVSAEVVREQFISQGKSHKVEFTLMQEGARLDQVRCVLCVCVMYCTGICEYVCVYVCVWLLCKILYALYSALESTLLPPVTLPGPDG